MPSDPCDMTPSAKVVIPTISINNASGVSAAPGVAGSNSTTQGSIKTARGQAKSKSLASGKNAEGLTTVPQPVLGRTVRTTASAAKTVSKGASSRKQSAVEDEESKPNEVSSSVETTAKVADISTTRAASPREKRAKKIVSKENSLKTADTGTAAEALPAGEGRFAAKTPSGVKTSAAAFFAARQRMAPAKPSAKIPPAVKPREDEQRQAPAGGGSNEVTSTANAAVVGMGHTANTPIMDRTPTETAPTTPAEGSRPGQMFDRAPAAKVPVKAPAAKGQGFKTGEFIVYPAHGVGQITAIEEQEVAGYKLELFVIGFVKDKMILKVPLPKIASVGMRKLAEPPVVKRALDTLMGRARVKRTMWSRRAQEYEAKINSGDLVAIAEVVRDLYRSDAQPEQSYSERQLYEAALDRMAREIAVVQKLSDPEALKVIDDQLQKGPRRSKVEETEVEDSDEPDDSGIVEAA